MENKTIQFYPEVKKHISPSALALWKRGKSAFMKSYFDGEKFKGSSATRGGNIIHKLIEEGFILVNCKYGENEKEIRVTFSEDTGFEVFGKPDSHGIDELGKAMFVDYKSGKESVWTDDILAGDIKMKITAWLVWKDLGEPDTVKGFIEYVPTVYIHETKETAWSGEPTEVVAEYTYTLEDMKQVELLIEQVVSEVNAEYLKWAGATSTFVNNEDIMQYAELQKQINELLELQKPIKERIKEQMSLGGIKSYKDDMLGTFSLSVKKSYNIPESLTFQVEETQYTLKEGEKIAGAMKVSVDNYKLTAEPSSTSESIGFRAKKFK